MKCRYIYAPLAGKHLSRRKTLMDSLRQWYIHKTAPKPDVFTVATFYPAVHPRRGA